MAASIAMIVNRSSFVPPPKVTSAIVHITPGEQPEGVEPRSLEFIMNQHRNPEHWQQSQPGSWTPVVDQTPSDQTGGAAAKDEAGMAQLERALGFAANSELQRAGFREYITIGKGFPT